MNNQLNRVVTTREKNNPKRVTTLTFVFSSAFPKLLAVRWVGQLSDGLFQSALASFVLFSPERAPTAMAAAGAFSLTLLPYSIVGPYVGIILDRFSRQRIILIANLIRASTLVVIAISVRNSAANLVLTCFILIAFGLNRLILAGLSAGLPLVVPSTKLIGANALSVTGGTISVVIGGGLGIGLKNILDQSHVSDYSDAVLILIACGGYITAAFLANNLGRVEIGPAQPEILRNPGWGEMLEGLRILKAHGDPLRGIIATAIQRGGLTSLTLMGLLLERNTFHPANNPAAGLQGFALAIGIAGIGIGIGSVISPFFVSRSGRHIWIRTMMVGSIPGLILFSFFQNQATLVIAAFFVGLCGQAVKVTNDALVQSKIEDEFRGRTFAFYDVAVNAAIVSGATIAALILPTSGMSFILPLLISFWYILAAAIPLRKSNFSAALPTI